MTDTQLSSVNLSFGDLFVLAVKGQIAMLCASIVLVPLFALVGVVAFILLGAFGVVLTQ